MEVLIRDFETAADFLAALAPLPAAGYSDDGTWRSGIYRGHADDDYLLVPSALRDSDILSTFGHHSYDNQSQIEAEIEMIYTFFDIADARGLQLPEDSQALRKRLRFFRTLEYWKQLDEGLAGWPPEDIWSICALAQHYGLPTRFLDWSRRPLIAAYFAAEGALRSLRQAQRQWYEANFACDVPNHRSSEAVKTKNLCVWVFNAEGTIPLKLKENNLASFRRPPNYPFAQVTAPHAGNANLHAQDGLFTVAIEDFRGRLKVSVDRMPFDQRVETARTDKGYIYGPAFARLRLPWSQAPDLITLLRYNHVDRSTVYPGYGGVVSLMAEMIDSSERHQIRYFGRRKK
jgi:hypothetical protein